MSYTSIMKSSWKTFIETDMYNYISNDIVVLIRIHVLHIELINKLLHGFSERLPVYNITYDYLHNLYNSYTCNNPLISPSRLCLVNKGNTTWSNRIGEFRDDIDSMFKSKYYMAGIELFPQTGYYILHKSGMYSWNTINDYKIICSKNNWKGYTKLKNKEYPRYIMDQEELQINEGIFV